MWNLKSLNWSRKVKFTCWLLGRQGSQHICHIHLKDTTMETCSRKWGFGACNNSINCTTFGFRSFPPCGTWITTNCTTFGSRSFSPGTSIQVISLAPLVPGLQQREIESSLWFPFCTKWFDNKYGYHWPARGEEVMDNCIGVVPVRAGHCHEMCRSLNLERKYNRSVNCSIVKSVRWQKLFFQPPTFLTGCISASRTTIEMSAPLKLPKWPGVS